MSDEQQAAFIMAQAACLMGKVLGMQAENMQRECTGQSMAYTMDDFAREIDASGCAHNSVLTLFQG